MKKATLAPVSPGVEGKETLQTSPHMQSLAQPV